jgi:hypothetical protein
MVMYNEAHMAVRMEDGITDWFKALVGSHQGSLLSLLLFITVMDVTSTEICGDFTWELLYADDFVLLAES